MKYTNTRKSYLTSKTTKASNGSSAPTSDMILEQLNQRKLDRQQSAINSAALQDHIMKSFNLKGLDPFKKQKTQLPPRQTSFQNNGMQILQTSSNNNISSSGISQQSNQRHSIAHHTFGYPYDYSQNIVDSSQQPNHSQPNALQKILEDQTIKDESAYLNIEKKRLAYINKLSLAQRLGLVEKPALPLSQVQWKQIEQQSLKRFNDKEPCPICYEDLRFQDQAILSCSHVFHKKCLDSFEKFMRNSGQEKACPICRKKDYDQKTYAEGQKRYLLRCIEIIQAVVRGFLSRNLYYETMKKNGYQPRNKSMKKKLIGYKLSRIGKKYIDNMAKERLQVMEMVKKIDQSIVDTEQLLESFIPNMSRLMQSKREKELELRHKQSQEEVKLNKYWQGIRDKAATRGDKDCPICYNSYKGHKDIFLLNCSHMYHKCCLESFEKFDIAQTLSCPMCRHPNYQKTQISE